MQPIETALHLLHRYMQVARQRLPAVDADQLQRDHALVKSDADVGPFAARVVKKLEQQQQHQQQQQQQQQPRLRSQQGGNPKAEQPH
jgi:hypothetical protein